MTEALANKEVTKERLDRLMIMTFIPSRGLMYCRSRENDIVALTCLHKKINGHPISIYCCRTALCVCFETTENYYLSCYVTKRLDCTVSVICKIFIIFRVYVDHHEDISSSLFEEWFCNSLLPSLPKGLFR